MTRERIIPLHQNESYWLLDGAAAAPYASTDPLTYATYPRYDSLREAIAGYAGARNDQILLTAGSDASILLLAQHLRSAGKRTLLPVPTFYGYERIFGIAGLAYDTVVYREKDGSFEFPLEETLHALHASDAIFLCSPNNPLGCEIPHDDLSAVLDTCRERGILAVVDEAYYEYGGHTVLDRLGSQPLCLIRTLSKSFGLAGARIGYTIADATLVKALSEMQLPWPISHPTVHAALSALARKDVILPRIELIREARERFSVSLRDLPNVRVYASCTNFLLARIPDAARVREALSEQGILVANGESMSSVPEARILLHDTLRFAIPSRSDMGEVLSALRELCS